MVLPVMQRALTILLACLLLSGCDASTIVEDRSQREAIEIVALLHGYGINAVVRRESGSRGRYYLEVEKSARTQAQTILWEKGYPKESETTFNELVAPHGLIPNSSEIEALRVDRAMALELEEMLRNYPGVSSARAVVRVNYAKEHAGVQGVAPSVSVVVQQKQAIQLEPNSLVELVQRTVPGVAREQVTVVVQPETETVSVKPDEGIATEKGRVIRKNLVPFLYFYHVAEDSYSAMALTLVGCFVAVLLAGGIAGYWYGYYQTSKNFFEQDPNEGALKSLKFDRPKKDLPGV